MSRRAAAVILGNRTLRLISTINRIINPIEEVSSLFSNFSIRSHSFATDSSADPIETCIDLSTINCNGLSQSILSKCPNSFEGERRKFADNSSIKELLFHISDVLPDLTRRFRRVLSLKPSDVLQLLLGFQSQCDKIAIDGKKVEALWGIFNWASGQYKGFEHLVQSCEAMASLLIRYGMLREVQLLLLAMERQGISMDNNEIISKLIEGYVKASDLERAVLVYDRIREQGSVPLMSCYSVFIDLLVRMKRTQLAFKVCLDMVDSGIGLNDTDMAAIEKVVNLLCSDGMIQQARHLMKKATALGFKLDCLAVNEIAFGYCEKKDFEDALNIFAESKCPPSAQISNKIIHDLCCSFGSGRANSFRLELESLGLKPNEITFGILIGRCCSEGDLRGAFDHLADMLSRGLKPAIWSYNALIGALFCEGMSNHAQLVIDEMLERGIAPNSWTFRTLLAGYCKARQFNEMKMTVHKMEDTGFIDSSSLENPLSAAFTVLGIKPLSVRLKRDNNVGFSSAEFFDNLGNGLYLETDIDEFDKRVNDVLKGSMLPDFNSFLMTELDHGNIENVFLLIDEMAQWGQELSLPVFSGLVKRLCGSRSLFRTYSQLIDKMPKLVNQLDDEILNVLAQTYCRNGMTFRGKVIFNQMLCRNSKIENKTYTALLVAFCKRGYIHDFYNCWEIAQRSKWSPDLDCCKSLVRYLCRNRMLQEVSQLLETTLVSHPHSRSQLCCLLIGTLCANGFTSIALNLADELRNRGYFALDSAGYNHILHGFCKEKRNTEAFTALDTMLASNSVPSLDVSLILIPRLCSSGRCDNVMALREISSRERSFDRNSVDCAVVQGLCQAGEVREAENLVRDMLLNGLILDSKTCNILFQGYCRANSFKKVKEMLGVILRISMSPELATYRSFVRLICIQGNYHGLAFNMKELMLQNERYSSLVIYNILIFYLLSTGNSKQVNQLLIELEEKGLALDEASYNFLVYGFSKCKDVSHCVHYLSTMISKGFNPSYRSLQKAVTCLCEMGKLSEALEYCGVMEMRGWFHGSVLQNTVVKGLLSIDKVREAECFLDRMEDKGLIPGSINYDNLIKEFCFRGRPRRAVSLVDSMLRKGNIPSSGSYECVIRGLCLFNELDEAMDFYTEMLYRDLKPSMKTLETLVDELCRVGRTAEAEEVVGSVVRLGETPSRIMYSSVIDGYRRENNSRKASEVMEVMQKSGYEPDFDTQWSLISNLQVSQSKENTNDSEGFLSRLLSGSGFSHKNDSKFKKR